MKDNALREGYWYNRGLDLTVPCKLELKICILFKVSNNATGNYELVPPTVCFIRITLEDCLTTDL